MKNPLSYQITEYDCGPTTLCNALSYLYDREEIRPEVIKFIHLYCMDCFDACGEPCKNGTSPFAMVFLANWLNHFSQMKKWPVRCEVLTGDEVFLGQSSRIIAALQQGGVAAVRLHLECEHYVLLTGAGEGTVDVFDPYYWPDACHDPRVEAVHCQPTRMNRRIHWDVFNEEGMEHYNMGPKPRRECVLLFNTATRQDGATLEYSI